VGGICTPVRKKSLAKRFRVSQRFRFHMANLPVSNMSSKFSNTSTKEETTLNVPVQVSFIINLIFNGITCPLTVLLNVLVIMAVKRRRRLQSNSNILLACLATTDAFTGLLVQPSFILGITLSLCGFTTASLRTVLTFHNYRSTRRVCHFITSSDFGHFREAYGDQISHELPLYCHKEKH